LLEIVSPVVAERGVGNIGNVASHAVLHARAGLAPPSAPKAVDLARSFPFGRFAEPDKIAASGVFLLTDDVTYLTGANLLVEGGTLT